MMERGPFGFKYLVISTLFVQKAGDARQIVFAQLHFEFSHAEYTRDSPFCVILLEIQWKNRFC